MRDTLANMMSSFLMRRQQAHMMTSNSQFTVNNLASVGIHNKTWLHPPNYSRKMEITSHGENTKRISILTFGLFAYCAAKVNK